VSNHVDRELADTLRRIGLDAGLDAVGFASVKPFDESRVEIERRKAEGMHDGMAFTFKNPTRSTSPADALPDARTLVVAARSYRRADIDPETQRPQGRIARYSWIDHYAPLKDGLGAMGAHLKAQGWRTRILADDNTLVDRAAAYRAGIGWLGKNANLLLPGRGSWFVLGSVLTDAPLPTADESVADGCGSCVRCIDACPTGAIVAPGVVDGRRCLAWLAQKPGLFADEFKAALGDRIYGCDDCQEVCPPNRTADRRFDPPSAEPEAQPWTDLLQLASDTDGEIRARHGRFYLPERDPSTLRRNALIALGNVADPMSESVIAVVDGARSHANPGVSDAAEWALDRLTKRRGTLRFQLHVDQQIQQQVQSQVRGPLGSSLE
jgi:epoxyqueuosine reductase